MASHPFQLEFDGLPEVLPVFPLPGALVLPGSVLPLNIFEPRYLNMTLDALGNQRLIGMIQPDPARAPDGLLSVGCAGRVSAFQETYDGRLLINLTGVCRFHLGRELETQRGYRRTRPDWSAFAADMTPTAPDAVEPKALLEIATRFFKSRNIESDTAQLKQLSGIELSNFLTMHLPLDVLDKQMLLEAPSPTDRARSLLRLAELHLNQNESQTRH